jgi:alkylhydroperoxidase family enzyme
MTYRIAPASTPYTKSVQVMLDKLTPKGDPPLTLFTMLARDERLFGKFMAGGLLDRGHLTLRQREIVIDRVTAQCGSEYEWGVHVNYFAAHVGLAENELYSLVHGTHADLC